MNTITGKSLFMYLSFIFILSFTSTVITIYSAHLIVKWYNWTPCIGPMCGG